jgi:Xaa-Pro aminopeptidase
MQAHVLALGADYLDFCHLHTGVHSTIIHSWPLEIPTRPGDIIHLDFSAVFGGYRTDIGRTAVVEASNEKQERIYRQLCEIEQFMIENMRPGVVGGELYARAQSVFGKTGLVYPWGTMGHSTGSCVMEEGFEIADGSEDVLETGMIISVEPTHIEPGEARYRIEDTVVVTDAGVEVLSNHMPVDKLFVIH